MITRVLRGSLLAAAFGFALFSAGCDAADSNAVVGPDAPSLSKNSTTTGFLAGWSSTSQSDPALLKKLEDEKARIAKAQEDSKATYLTLKQEWDRLNETYPNGNPKLLYCDPLQYAAQTVIVGPNGADLGFGPHKLSIPRGALSQFTVITVEAPTSLAVEARFSPHGLRFLAQPTLTLSYKHCNRPSTFVHRLYYVDLKDRILSTPSSRDNSSLGLIEGWIWHFSRYAVGMN
jgi:hypothetical protein